VDYSEYIKNVLITEARDLEPVKGRLGQELNIRLTHASAGITSETAELFEASRKAAISGEVDRVNVLEECGDILWYVAIAADAMGKASSWSAHEPSCAKLIMRERGGPAAAEGDDDQVLDAMNRASDELARLSGDIVDLVFKKHIMYGRAHDFGKLEAALCDVHREAEKLLQIAGFTIAMARERNVAKLRARYGEKFTEEAALTRNLGAERKTLQGE
jgi:NTP pyrophosphatase (non-canonical NTP hydrolase)